MRDHPSASPRVSHLQPPALHHHRHHPLLLLLLLQLLHPHVGPPILCWAIRPTFTCPTSCSCSSSGTHSAGSSSSSSVGGVAGVGVSPVHVVDVAGIHVKCSGAGFSSVPEDLPAATSRLLLDANLIASLPPAVLRHLPALRELDLSGNRLEAISPGAFDGAARSLELLDLSANRLRSLRPASLAGLGPAVGMFLHGNPWHCDCELAAALSRVTVLGPGNREEMKKEVAPQLPEGGPGTPFEDDVGSTTL
ncbi:leucine-rich repeat-containing protein 3-like [Lethenteron reissneri]|uniref:leucine-rich repeat-containing protein 3-like n=1 Tax=Lethenteron reissneri TaxID=7753 RepID=UPI002AB6D46F|nr:leucine-rich repeat-containing protein 3-like [Lethenteron reissneri]